mmetsp:Transcript_29808/g.55727  ORF Transcript_29808/g.55727 Transcript_29808/m.55727 type:complete len:144 (-) Transcript_29808:613-1044(-)
MVVTRMDTTASRLLRYACVLGVFILRAASSEVGDMLMYEDTKWLVSTENHPFLSSCCQGTIDDSAFNQWLVFLHRIEINIKIKIKETVKLEMKERSTVDRSIYICARPPFRRGIQAIYDARQRASQFPGARSGRAHGWSGKGH